jgi:hypothetical protein
MNKGVKEEVGAKEIGNRREEEEEEEIVKRRKMTSKRKNFSG